MTNLDSPYQFIGEHVSSKVYYTLDWFDYKIQKITDIHVDRFYFKNSNHYILSFIDHIKDTIIKNCKDLNNLSIELLTFDSDNIVHRLIVSVAKFIKDFLKQKRPLHFNKSVFVLVLYDHKVLFTGLIDFTGLD